MICHIMHRMHSCCCSFNLSPIFATPPSQGFKVHIWRLVVNLLAVAMFTLMRNHGRSSRSSSPLELQMNSPNTMTKDH